MNKLATFLGAGLLVLMAPLAQGAIQLSFDVVGDVPGPTSCAVGATATFAICPNVVVDGVAITGFTGFSNSPGGPINAEEFGSTVNIRNNNASASVPPKGGRKHPQQEFLQVDTTNILFICGGAFVGLEDIIENRIGQKMIGFGAAQKRPMKKDRWELLKEVQPEDLLKYGMIPEFIGRLPVIAPLHELNEDALVQILTQPKNALVKQYQKLFEMDGVKLKFTKGALYKVAQLASQQKSGARGLRAILESALLDIMFETPGQSVSEVIINEDVIEKHAAPIITYTKEAKAETA